MNSAKRISIIAVIALLALLGIGVVFFLQTNPDAQQSPISDTQAKPTLEEMKEFCPVVINEYTEAIRSYQKVSANDEIIIEKVDGYIAKQGDPNTGEGTEYTLKVTANASVLAKEMSIPLTFKFTKTERGWTHSSPENTCVIPR